MTSVTYLGREERRFLEATPWKIDGLRQPPDSLIRVLENEAQRFSESPHRPVFSIVTPLLGADPRRLEELILSLRCQSWGFWELLLVGDGGRSGPSLEVARRWERRDARVRLLVPERDGGTVAAKNFAIDQSRGGFRRLPGRRRPAPSLGAGDFRATREPRSSMQPLLRQ